MDKNIIKKHLTERFLSEANDQSNTPGITVTKAVQKKSGQENKAGVKAIEKDLTAYSKDVKKDKDMSKMVQNKFNYEDGEKEFHDQMEIMNGQEMIEFDREPNKTFKDRAKEGLTGSSRMGNKGGKDMGNAEAMEGVSSDDFGKERLKNAADSTKKRQDAVKGIISFGDDIETVPKNYAPMQKHTALSENNNNPKIKETMKRLKFNKNGDKPFEGVNLTQKLGHALTLIPESYKVDNKEFEMTDGSVSCKVRWEGTLNEGKAIVLLASDKTMINEDMQKMKHLMGYKSQETLGTVKGKERLDENAIFGDIWNKTKTLLEGSDIESAKAKTGNLEDIKKKAPEATKHVEGSVSKDKGTQAPAAKEGDLDDAVSHAPEAKKHVEGSVSTEKGTKAPKPKTGEWDNIKKKATEATKHVNESVEDEDEDDDMPEAPSHEETDANQVTEESTSTSPKSTGGKNIEGTKAANGEWEKINVPHAAEAKKHIHMGKESTANQETVAKEEPITEGVTLNGTFFAPLNENWEESEEEVVKEGEFDEEGGMPAPEAATPKLMVSQSTGQYFIVGAGPKPVPVPLEDKEIANRNPAEYLENISNTGGGEGLEEYGDEHGVSTQSAVNSMNTKPKKGLEEYGDEHGVSTQAAVNTIKPRVK